MPPQGCKPLLAGGQVIAVEHAQRVAGQRRSGGERRHHRRKPLSRAPHQGAQDARLGVVDLGIERTQSTGNVPFWRAAACREERSPSETSVISSTTVENINSREYWRRRSASNTASTQSGGNAYSNAVRAITRAGACRSKRARTTGQTGPDRVDASVIHQGGLESDTLKGVGLRPTPFRVGLSHIREQLEEERL